MGKVYSIVAIDDEPVNMEMTLKTLTKYVKRKHGYDLKCAVYSQQSDFDRVASEPIDIVMFDMALNGSDFMIADEATRWGYELIKKFRKLNKRTKIIFYSGFFNMNDAESFPFTELDFVHIINDLNVFAIIPRGDVDLMGETVVRAIENIDSVLVSLEDLILNYGEDGKFRIADKDYSADELLTELRMGSTIGEEFRKKITETIVAYFMKFGE